MTKKILLSFIFLLSFAFVSHSYAYTSWTNNCVSSTDNASITVVSENDLLAGTDIAHSIPICVSLPSSSLPITIKDTTHYNSTTPSPTFSINSVDSNNHGFYGYQWNFLKSDVGNTNGVPFTFSGVDALGNATSANLTVNIKPADITLTNNKGLENGKSYTLAEIGNTSTISPYAPVNVNIGSHGEVGKVWLDWTNNVNATTCFVYYGTDYGAAVAFSNSAHSGGCTNRSITGLSAGTYYFKVGNYYNNTYNYSDNQIVDLSDVVVKQGQSVLQK